MTTLNRFYYNMTFYDFVGMNFRREPRERGAVVGGGYNAPMRYNLNVTFHGTATLEIDADTPEAARQAATELTPVDLARQGHADILTFKIAAREVTPAAALGGEHDEPQAENAPHKPRPSGWYRPH